MANKQILDYNNLLPVKLKTENETLTALTSNLFNRFISEEKSVSISGRIGKQVAGDARIYEPSLEREFIFSFVCSNIDFSFVSIF
jgi:hypothetical protein